MKINWTKGVSETGNRNYWSIEEDFRHFTITEQNNKNFWLHLNLNYIGSFTTFKKAQKVVELILEG